jgi:AcrR family transcriptional regulator
MVGNARGPYRTGIRTRAQIVVAATEVFGNVGFHAGSVRMIADRVGTSPATVMQHFGSKEGLLTAVIEDWSAQTRLALGATDLRGLAYLERLDGLMPFHYAHRGLQTLFTTLTAEAVPPEHPAHDFIQQRYARTLSDWSGELRWAVDHGETAPMDDAQIHTEIRLLIATADGLELQWLLDPTFDLAGTFRDYLHETLARWRTHS